MRSRLQLYARAITPLAACNMPLAFGASLWSLPSGGLILALLYHGGGCTHTDNRRANPCDTTHPDLAKPFSNKAHDSVLQRGAFEVILFPAIPMYNVSYGGECRVERFFFHYTSEQLKGKWRVYAMPPMREASAPQRLGS